MTVNPYLSFSKGRYKIDILNVIPGRHENQLKTKDQTGNWLDESWIVPLAANCVVQLIADIWQYHSENVTKIDNSPAVWEQDLGLLCCETDMKNSSFPGRVS